MDDSLRSSADKRKIFVGTAVNTNLLDKDQDYKNLLKKEFNMVVAENAMKWNHLRPNIDTYLFDDADKLIDYAEKNHMAIRGHTLVWGAKMPDWFNQLDSNRKTKSIVEHIDKVVGRFRGKIYAWDVVNEALDDNGEFAPSELLSSVGTKYIEESFIHVREADPNTKLFWNEWGGDRINKRSDRFYKEVKELLSRNIPIDGVGFQMHTGLGRPETTTPLPDIRSVRENFKRFADLGLEIHITEMDVQIQSAPGSWQDKLQQEADFYGEIMKMSLEFPNFKAFLVWGVDDKHSWISTYLTDKKDAPLLFDESYKPKLAYYAVKKALED